MPERGGAGGSISGPIQGQIPGPIPEHGHGPGTAVGGRSNRPEPSTAGRGATSSYSEARNDLSEREVEIIELVATGLTNQEIALQLTISKRTVDNHVSNIFTKTGAKNRVALLNWAMDNGKICRDGFNCCALPGDE
jgi:DNA-binding CsgD family transcriptional regulator